MRRADAILGGIFGLAAALTILVMSHSGLSRQLSREAAVAEARAEADAAVAAFTGSGGGRASVAAGRAAAGDPGQLAIADAGSRRLLGLWPSGEGPRPLKPSEKGYFDRAIRLAGHGVDNLEAVSTDGQVRVSVPLSLNGGPGVVEALRVIPSSGLGAIVPLLPLFAAVALVFVFQRARVLVGEVPAIGRWAALGGAGAGAALAALFFGQAIGGARARLMQSGQDEAQRLFAAYGQTSPTIAPEFGASVSDAFSNNAILAVLAALGVAAIFAFGAGRRVWNALVAYRSAYAYAAPAVIGALVLVFFPFLYGVAISFTDTTLVNQTEPFVERWTGLSNYASILGDINLIRTGDEGWSINYQSFWWTLFVTVLWTVTNVALGVSLGLALALLLNTPALAGKAVYRVLLILPWAVPNYITALVWKGMFHPQFGVVNQSLQLVGFAPVAWFDSFAPSFLTGLAANVWLSFPFMMVVSLGALQSVSKDMYEAARLEGASGWRRFIDITLPSIRPALVPAVILSVVWTFNMFNVIYLVSGGEPAGANEILITQAYKIGFEQYRYGYSAAYSVVIFAILLAYGVFQVRATRATEQL